ncbi:MAG: hypothetical protein ABSC56_00365 [Solirubrobacteraceae bacterium]|jgi:hypothetical protein
MREIAPGLWHWSAVHPHTHWPAHSYYLETERVAIDPMLPPAAFEWFASHTTPQHTLLTNRHHDRDAWRLHELFGTDVHCVRAGIYELEGRGPVTAFDFGDELPGDVLSCEVGGICPDETALYIAAHAALACADGVVRRPGEDRLTFVPDSLMDDPQETKMSLRNAYGRLADELDFELLLLAHGDPVARGGNEALREFARVTR